MKKSKDLTKLEVLEFFENLISGSQLYTAKELKRYLKAAGRIAPESVELLANWQELTAKIVSTQKTEGYVEIKILIPLFCKYLAVRGVE